MSSSLGHDQLKERIRLYLETAWNSQGRNEIAAPSEQTEENDQPNMHSCDRNDSVHFEDPLHVYLGAERLSIPLAQARQIIRKTFPDIRMTVVDIVAEAEKVAVRWIMHGTDLGGYKNYLPTGKSISITGMVMLRCENNVLREEWIEIDIAGMLHQLGYVAVPQPPRITIRRSGS